MKTNLLIILFVFSILFPTYDVFAPPSLNPDWQSAPYCPGGCPLDYLKQKWAEYYDIKGSEWMETKKQEMLVAMESGTMDEWRNKDPTMAHYNVYTYYFIKGEIPDHDGKYVDQIYAEQEWQKLEQQIGQGYLPIGEYTLSLNIIIIAALLIGVGILIWISRRK